MNNEWRDATDDEKAVLCRPATDIVGGNITYPAKSMASLMQKKMEHSKFTYQGPTTKYVEKNLVIKVKKGKDEVSEQIEPKEGTGGESTAIKDSKKLDTFDEKDDYYHNPTVNSALDLFADGEMLINPEEEEAFEEPLF